MRDDVGLKFSLDREVEGAALRFWCMFLWFCRGRIFCHASCTRLLGVPLCEERLSGSLLSISHFFRFRQDHNAAPDHDAEHV